MTEKVTIDISSGVYPDIKTFDITTATITVYTNVKDLKVDRLFDALPDYSPTKEQLDMAAGDCKKIYGKVGMVIGARNGDKYKGVRKLFMETTTKPITKKFPHQITAWFTVEKNKNATAMIFSNGTLNITGAKKVEHARKLTRAFFNYIWRLQKRSTEPICTFPEKEVFLGIVHVNMIDINMRILQKLGRKRWIIEYFRDVVKYPGSKVVYNEEHNSSVNVEIPYTAPENPVLELLMSKPNSNDKLDFSISTEFSRKMVGKLRFSIETEYSTFTYKMQRGGRTNLTQTFILHPNSIIQSGRHYNDIMPEWYEKFMGYLKDYLKWVNDTKHVKVEKLSLDDFLD